MTGNDETRINTVKAVNGESNNRVTQKIVSLFEPSTTLSTVSAINPELSAVKNDNISCFIS